jgi:hypothetical protein
VTSASSAQVLEVREFAVMHGFSPATLYRWRSGLSRGARSRSSVPRLADVTLLASNGLSPRAGETAYELSLTGGRRLTGTTSMLSPEQLGKLA